MSTSKLKTKQQQTTTTGIYSDKKSPRPLPGLSFEEPPTSSEMSRLLKELNEKEQDLELAANLGNSLLQENKELLEKNEFLEESLATSNETISQLQKHLKQRSKLFKTIVDLENEYNEEEKATDNACCSNNISCSKFVDFSRMEQKICNLQKENNKLRSQVDNLEEHKINIEKRERNTISDYMSQLRAANLKIAQIQVQLGDKSKQCESQTEEIQRLLADISERKRRERILWDENEDIQIRLDEALHNHEQLRNEMEQLQERHLDLVVMLRDTEDELKLHRQRAEAPPPPPILRTNSVDSLYDSLASELEGADSGGCYGTPMFSARYGPSTHCSSLCFNDQQQQFSSSQQPSTSSSVQPSIEIPPTFFLEEVCNSLENKKFQKLNSKQKRKISKEEGEKCQDSPTTPIVDCISINNRQQEKIFQDACCSPIQFSPKQSIPTSLSLNKFSNVALTSSSSFWKFSTPPQQDNTKNKRISSPQLSSGSSSESIDSIDNYSPPKLGTPGIPGSKDLELSIRRSSVKREINEGYAHFRNSRGLPPSQNEFYSPKYQFIFQSSFQSQCPTKQLNRLCVNDNSPIISKSSPECSRFSCRPIKKEEKGKEANNNNLINNIHKSYSSFNYSLSGTLSTNNGGIFSSVNLFGRNCNGKTEV
ncbi:hypothetical protein Mgra_00003001 [Meloidogyne graminicola]|uniref:HAP1 N-terminal domain-containing protein n=1 Tax=Meloidogyne graminicola TaxID=189291 RepID=A0A8S9ZWP8_9BILA|nr:hypothetical protein Mgra_00003001 [Meloidogyne graminicola]